MWTGAIYSSPRSSTRSGQPAGAYTFAIRVWPSVDSHSRPAHSVSGDAACVVYMWSPRARELLACGFLEARDKKPQVTFVERITITGMPSLPEGYKFTDWMR